MTTAPTITDAMVLSADLPELENIIGSLHREMVRIRSQIEEARAYHITTGEYRDADWYRRANGALRAKGYLHQCALRRAAELRRNGKKETQDSFERAFIDAARRRLTPEAFDGIWQEAMGEEERT